MDEHVSKVLYILAAVVVAGLIIAGITAYVTGKMAGLH